jgi:hypothetical protein
VKQLAMTRFTYVNDSPARVEITMGDARLSMEREQRQDFDLLVLDAFSSDAIPVHLLTKEACELYLRHLKPNGIIAVHISNHYLDLEPVVVNLAKHFGFRLALIDFEDDLQVSLKARRSASRLSHSRAGRESGRDFRYVREFRGLLHAQGNFFRGNVRLRRLCLDHRRLTRDREQFEAFHSRVIRGREFCPITKRGDRWWHGWRTKAKGNDVANRPVHLGRFAKPRLSQVQRPGAISRQIALILAGISVGAIHQIAQGVQQVGVTPIMPFDQGPQRDNGFIQLRMRPRTLGLRNRRGREHLPARHLLADLRRI